jgi:uncharacterized SAM-binding protein YcdF (DUF218 family)
MSMLVFFAVIVGATVTLAFNWRRTSLALFCLLLVVIVLIGSGLIPQMALSGLQTRSQTLKVEWKTKNWIVLLGVGTVRWPQSELITSHTLAYSRMFEAARLYFACKKVADFCRILATGGDPSRTGISEAETLASELQNIGVNKNDLMIEPKSNNTFQNAEFSSAILKAEGFDVTVLVTSGFHMSRSLLYFSQFMEKPIPAPSDQLSAIFSALPISHNFTYLDIAMYEHLRLLRDRIDNWLRWNPVTSKPNPHEQ